MAEWKPEGHSSYAWAVGTNEPKYEDVMRALGHEPADIGEDSSDQDDKKKKG